MFYDVTTYEGCVESMFSGSNLNRQLSFFSAWESSTKKRLCVLLLSQMHIQMKRCSAMLEEYRQLSVSRLWLLYVSLCFSTIKIIGNLNTSENKKKKMVEASSHGTSSAKVQAWQNIRKLCRSLHELPNRKPIIITTTSASLHTFGSFYSRSKSRDCILNFKVRCQFRQINFP